MRSVRVALALGLLGTAVGVAAVLAERPLAVLATNSVVERGALARFRNKSARVCQAGERLPRGTLAVRVSLETLTGPPLRVSVSSAGRELTSGELGSGWTGRGVTIPLRPLQETVAPVEICVVSSAGNEPVEPLGSRSPQTAEAYDRQGDSLGGSIRIEYLGRGSASWLDRARSIARQMGLGRGWSGAWIAPFVLLLMLAAAAVSSLLVLREHDE